MAGPVTGDGTIYVTGMVPTLANVHGRLQPGAVPVVAGATSAPTGTTSSIRGDDLALDSGAFDVGGVSDARLSCCQTRGRGRQGESGGGRRAATGELDDAAQRSLSYRPGAGTSRDDCMRLDRSATETLAAAGARLDRGAGSRACLGRSSSARSRPARARSVGRRRRGHDVLLDGGRPLRAVRHPDQDLGRGDRPGAERHQGGCTPAVIVADAISPSTSCGPRRRCSTSPRTRWRSTTASFTAVDGARSTSSTRSTAPWQLEPMLAACAELSGWSEAFLARPRLSFVCCTHSPPGVGHPLLDLNVELARHGAPILVYPMLIAGVMAPMTVAGAVVMNLSLSSGLRHRDPARGARRAVLTGAGTSLLDMKAGTFCFGAVEQRPLCAPPASRRRTAASAFLRRRPALATDALHGGVQAGDEKALKGLAVAQSGQTSSPAASASCTAPGCSSLPQVVIDGEIAVMVLRLLGGAEVSAETVIYEVTARVGWDGDLPSPEGDLEATSGRGSLPAGHRRDRPWRDGRRTAATSRPGRQRAHELVAAVDAVARSCRRRRARCCGDRRGRGDGRAAPC